MVVAPVSLVHHPSGNSHLLTTSTNTRGGAQRTSSSHSRLLVRLPMARISQKRRDELGIGDDEDEYDLDKALETNTDPLITKIVAGSLIVAILALLVVGVIVPVTTDYGEGVCNPMLTGGRCL